MDLIPIYMFNFSIHMENLYQDCMVYFYWDFVLQLIKKCQYLIYEFEIIFIFHIKYSLIEDLLIFMHSNNNNNNHIIIILDSLILNYTLHNVILRLLYSWILMLNNYFKVLKMIFNIHRDYCLILNISLINHHIK